MDKISYAEKLKDPRWQKKRLEIFERDKWTCRGCGAKEDTLHIHHLSYPDSHDPWDSDCDQLVTICENCHNEEYEERHKYEEYIISSLKSKGFTASGLFDIWFIIEDLIPFSYGQKNFISQLNILARGGRKPQGYEV